jgi:hypothetical protein
LFVHVHVPKCAGTSLWYWLARHNPGAHGFLYPNVPPSFYYDAGAIAELGIADTALRCMSSHYFRVFPARCAERDMRWFTLLRDPLEHYVSWARYMRKVYPDITDPEQRVNVPPAADQLSLRDFTAWILDQPDDVPFRENYQTNYFASYEWRTRTGRGPTPGELQPRWSPEDWADYRRERGALARAVLDGFAIVGTVERMAETLQVLAQRAPGWGLRIGPLDDVGHINATRSGDRNVEWISADDPVGRRLLASLEEDRALYAYASALLDRTLAAP